MSPQLETPSAPSLPPELLAEILSHLTTSPGALKSWSLLSRTFLPRAQKILFASITVRVRPPPTQHTRPVRQLSSAADLWTLLSASPHLAAYVRRLTLELGWPVGLQSEEDGEALLRCVPLLSGLRELRLAQRRVAHRDTLSKTVWFAVASLLRSARLEHLHLDDARLALTAFCASVKRLSIIGGYGYGALADLEAQFSDTPLPRLKVEELCVNWYDPEDAVKTWVLTGGVDVGGLKRLSLIFREGVAKLTQVEGIIALCAAGLEELTLEPHGAVSFFTLLDILLKSSTQRREEQGVYHTQST
ncbi:hypothetical protein B0H34DRAFT_479498 [Crassisporium funariophilum]|nr:hypothetical protein B0H34DRAFT_479498 [Crassisporium funariophilum]